MVTSVGPGRPETASTPVGAFQYRYLAEELRFGYAKVEVAPRQFAFVASPDKALFDLVHLTPGADSDLFLRELRLQNLGVFQPATLVELARRSGKPKLVRASRIIHALLAEEEGEPL